MLSDPAAFPCVTRIERVQGPKRKIVYIVSFELIAIDGRLKTHEWESEGSRRWMTEVIVNRLEFLGPKPQSAEPVAQGGEPSDLGEAEYGEEIAPTARPRS